MILLDTHALVWLTSGDERLGPRTRRLLEQTAKTEESLVVSAISFWEVAILVTRGRIELGSSVAVWRNDVLALGIDEIPIDGEVAVASVDLPRLHADPADRLIAATAIHRSAVLVTADERLLGWKNPLRRHDARR